MYYKIKNEICSAFSKWIIKVQKVNFWRGNLCKYFLVSLTKIYIAFLDNMSRPNCLTWHNLVGKCLSLCLESKVLGAKKKSPPYLGNLTSYHCILCEEEQKMPLKHSHKNRTKGWSDWKIDSLIYWFNKWFISWIVSLLIN